MYPFNLMFDIQVVSNTISKKFYIHHDTFVMQKKIDLPTYWLNKFGDFDMECRGKVGVLNTTRPECLPDDQFVVE